MGVILVRKLSLEAHIKNITRVNFFNLRNKTNHLLSRPASVSSMPSSRLDNCNALLVGNLLQENDTVWQCCGVFWLWNTLPQRGGPSAEESPAPIGGIVASRIMT